MKLALGKAFDDASATFSAHEGDLRLPEAKHEVQLASNAPWRYGFVESSSAQH